MTDINVSSLQDTIASMDALKGELDGIRKAYMQRSSEVFAQGSKHLFEQFPFVHGVVWTQYTPYFNDGEECVFSAHIDEPGIGTAKDFDEGDVSPYEPGREFYAKAEQRTYLGYDNETKKSRYADNENYDPEYGKAEQAFAAFLRAIPRESYKEMFGDHVQCLLTRAGVEVTEYSHD